ncbi:protein translocase subunit SecA [Candidatus Saccharibacteria bacterium]|nr:protein translocase subunit SecA [Candidatus Saccharibacteria bacterium]
MSFLSKIFGDPNEREIKKDRLIVEKINSLEEGIKALTDKQLSAKTDEFKQRLSKKETLDDILPEAFAVVREASKRKLNQRHFDVQLIGGIVLHEGKIAEMRTGEGKTLVATLPLYLNALTEKGVHLVTVNDYLARIGVGWMGQIYHFLGMSSSVVLPQGSFMYDPEYSDDSHHDERLRHLRPVSKKEAYEADITYGTNNEFGFDYLRDNMVGDLSDCAQRKLNYAIVDEVDSILIDEARTPLIISQPAGKSTERYQIFAKLARQLKRDEDYKVDEKDKAVKITSEGISKIEKSLGVENVYSAESIEDVHHIEQSLKAEALFVRDKDYVVSEGEIVIVDEFTGRMLAGRRYSEGLHQAIEAKEGVIVQSESQTLATITFQNYFRLYNKLSGMTGTAQTEAEEFAKIYKLEVTRIPTHRPMIRKDLKDRIYKSEIAKFNAVAEEVKDRISKGQPVLLGSASIEKNEILSALLTKAGVKHETLNAKNNEREAEIIALAGQKKAVTLATNIAGRGTDIVLGEGVKELGGLHVIGTERHESRRIDNQLRGRAGRQGDPGSSQFFVSVEDDLMRIFGGDRIGSLMASLNIPDDVPIENQVISRSLENAQKRVEGHNFDIRKHLVEYDDVMNSQREVIYAKRRKYLEGLELRSEVEDMFKEEVASVVMANTDARTGAVNLKELQEAIDTILPLPKDWSDKITTKVPELITEDIMDKVKAALNDREKTLGDVMNVVYKMVCLKTIDSAWLAHLENMDHLRDGIGLRGYGQRDPLVEYKAEAFGMFNRLQVSIRSEIVNTILKVDVREQPQAIETETELTEGAERANTAMEQSIKKQSKQSAVKTRKVSAKPSLKPIRKKSKKKKKKRK